MKKMSQAFRIVFNMMRFVGKSYYKRVFAVSASTRIDAGKNLIIGKGFRTRNNVEINVRDNGLLEIGNSVFINSNTVITCRNSIKIGDDTIIGPNVCIFDNDHKIENGHASHNEYECDEIIIGKNVWLGAGSIILKGVKIGDNSVISAGSVVVKDIPADSVLIQKKENTLKISGGIQKLMFKCKILLKVIFTKFYMYFPNLISDKNHAKLLYWCMFGKLPNLKNPKTFNEYLCAEKIKDYKLDYWKYTDKYEAREYVKSVIGDKYLNEVIGIYTSFDDIDFDKMPRQFVMKGTHGSSYNIIVTDKDKLDIKVAAKKYKKWLNENFYFKDREKNYKNIKPRIMVDKFLSPADGVIEEFKLFCFYGKVRMISYNKGEGHNRRTQLYDENWEKLDVKYGYSGFDVEKLPDNKDELVKLSEELSKPFDFVRVDLYNIDGKIYFSELTFHPGGGLVPFTPSSFDETLGKFLKKETV